MYGKQVCLVLMDFQVGCFVNELQKIQLVLLNDVDNVLCFHVEDFGNF